MEGWLEYMEQIDGGIDPPFRLTQTNWHGQTFTAAETKGRMTTRACAQRSHQTSKRLICAGIQVGHVDKKERISPAHDILLRDTAHTRAHTLSHTQAQRHPEPTPTLRT